MSAASQRPATPVGEILQRESEWRPRVAVIAAVAAVLLMAGSVVQLSGPHAKVNELTLGLIVENKRLARDIIGASLTGLAAIGVSITLVFIWGAARARNPQTQSYIRIVAVLGAFLTAVFGVAGWIAFGATAHKFVTQGAQTYQQANHLTKSASLVVLPYLGYGGELLLAISIVLVALAAMRVGLLTRFLGYFGMFAGVLFLFPLIPIPLVQAYWLGAVAYLLSGRWPSGVPQAWATGRAEKWPTTQELREQRVRAANARAGGRTKPAPEPEPVGAPARPSSGPSARSSQKRKRKRRK
jgi:hypothetical protein